MNEERLDQVARKFVEKKENLGESSGGSGHVGYKSYNVNSVTVLEEFNEDGRIALKVKISYTTIVETEFTYYPDNPPCKNNHEAIILVDSDGNFLRELT